MNSRSSKMETNRLVSQNHGISVFGDFTKTSDVEFVLSLYEIFKQTFHQEMRLDSIVDPTPQVLVTRNRLTIPDDPTFSIVFRDMRIDATWSNAHLKKYSSGVTDFFVKILSVLQKQANRIAVREEVVYSGFSNDYLASFLKLDSQFGEVKDALVRFNKTETINGKVTNGIVTCQPGEATRLNQAKTPEKIQVLVLSTDVNTAIGGQCLYFFNPDEIPLFVQLLAKRSERLIGLFIKEDNNHAQDDGTK